MSQFRTVAAFLGKTVGAAVSALLLIIYIAVTVILAIPVILIILVFNVLGIGKAVDRSVGEVSTYIRNFLDGTGDAWDWDNFISVPIADQHLEKMRQISAEVDLPLSPEGRAILKNLLNEAEQRVRERRAINRSIVWHLRRAIDGADISESKLTATLRNDPPLSKVGERASHELLRWAADLDIRARDPGYASAQRALLTKLLKQLEAEGCAP